VERPVSVALVAMRCRTSDRTAGHVRGVGELAPLLGKRLGVEPRLIGEPGEPREASFADDLRDSRGCLLEAGGQVGDALDGRRVPLLLGGDCSISLTTLPAVYGCRPDAHFLWLDAHGDFNTPDTTLSGYLGGMSLAGACGRWDAGLGAAAVPEDRLVLAGVRELDPSERRALEGSPAHVIGSSPVETLVAVKNALDRAPVYIHLDLDVIESFPSLFPAPGGLAPEKVFDLLEAVADSCEILGAEVTAFEAPEDDLERQEAADTAAHALEPLLDAIAEGARVGT